jgi:proteasome lid subunit RPN8/RPN11
MNIYEGRDDIKAHAIESAPNECCGLIIKKGQHQTVIRCRNVSHTPEHTFQIDPKEYRAAEAEGEVLAVYHSHYAGSAVATDADKTVAEANKLPFLIYAHPADTWDIYTPCGWRAKLEGRPFVHGILDCYSLVRDYYHDMCGIELDDFYREDDWWMPVKDPVTGEVIKEAQNLYMENAERQGFVRVNDLQVHDSILMMYNAPVVNHVAVLCEPGMILHHPPGHLSGRHPYIPRDGYFSDITFGIYRHKTLL